MDAGDVGHAVALAGEAQRPVQVVGAQGGDDRDDDGGEAEADEELPERQPEHVEAGVHVQDRVAPGEVAAFAEQQPRLPAGLGGHAGEDADDHGHAGDPPAGLRGEELPVAFEALLLGRGGPGVGPQAPGEVEVDAGPGGHGECEHGEQADPVPHHGREDRRVADRVVPEVVGAQAHEPSEHRQQHNGGHEEDQHVASSSAHPWGRGRPVRHSKQLLCVWSGRRGGVSRSPLLHRR